MLLLSFIIFRLCNFSFDVIVKIILSKNEADSIFHAKKFSIPSSLSSSIVLGAILSRRSLKMKFLKMKNWPYQEMRLTEASWLVHLIFGDSKSSPFKIHWWDFDLQFSCSMVFCSFLVQIQNRVWLSRDISTQKFWSRAQLMLSREAQLSMQSNL